jgi:hypothetical protein
VLFPVDDISAKFANVLILNARVINHKFGEILIWRVIACHLECLLILNYLAFKFVVIVISLAILAERIFSPCR